MDRAGNLTLLLWIYGQKGLSELPRLGWVPSGAATASISCIRCSVQDCWPAPHTCGVPAAALLSAPPRGPAGEPYDAVAMCATSSVATAAAVRRGARIERSARESVVEARSCRLSALHALMLTAGPPCNVSGGVCCLAAGSGKCWLLKSTEEHEQPAQSWRKRDNPAAGVLAA